MHRLKTMAWVVKGDEGYGVRACVLGLAQGVRQAGVRAVFAALEEGAFVGELRRAGFEVGVVGCGAPMTLGTGVAGRARVVVANGVASAGRARAVAGVLRGWGPEIVHVVWPNLVSIAGRAARLVGGRCVWEMPNIIGNSLPYGLNRRMYQWTCERWGVTVLSNSDYTGRTYGTGARTPITYYPATDSARFDPAKVTPRTRASLGIPEDAQVFTIVSRISDSKGQVGFFEGLLRVQRAGEPERHLLLLGGPTDGPEAVAIREMAARAGMADRVHFAGVVADAETYYPLTDVGVNSRVDPEPFGLSVIESMLMGRPVLVHALGGPAETVVDGVTGWHCHGTMPEAWERALRRVLADRPRWGEMGAAARERANQNFTTQRVTARYLGIVEKVLGSEAV